MATCEVAVDTETGEVEILRFGVVADPGKIMRRTLLEGEIHQAMDFNGRPRRRAGCRASGRSRKGRPYESAWFSPCHSFGHNGTKIGHCEALRKSL